MTRRNIVCICGSGRFWNEILQAAADLTLKGNVVLQPNFNAKGERVIRPIDKDRLDALHLDKIDMADELFVVNQDGYIGESTRNEIEHAMRKGKPVFYLDPKRAPVIPVIPDGARGEKSITLPDPEVVTLRRAAALFHNERTQLLQDVCVLLEQCEVAWGVIANVNGGDWKPTPKDWREAAEKWRDRWHEILRSPVMDKTKKLRAERHLQERISRTVAAAKAGHMDDVQGELAAIAELLQQAWSDPKETGA
jgi:hypothetical protein